MWQPVGELGPPHRRPARVRILSPPCSCFVARKSARIFFRCRRDITGKRKGGFRLSGQSTNHYMHATNWHETTRPLLRPYTRTPPVRGHVRHEERRVLGVRGRRRQAHGVRTCSGLIAFDVAYPIPPNRPENRRHLDETIAPDCRVGELPSMLLCLPYKKAHDRGFSLSVLFSYVAIIYITKNINTNQQMKVRLTAVHQKTVC